MRRGDMFGNILQ